MPIGFPSSPTVGQPWPVVDPVWEWDSAKWVKTDSAPPAGPPMNHVLLVWGGASGFPPTPPGCTRLADSNLPLPDGAIYLSVFLAPMEDGAVGFGSAGAAHWATASIMIEGTIREVAASTRYWGADGGGDADRGSPSLVAVAGDTVYSVYIYEAENSCAGAPSSGYVRDLNTPRVDFPGYGISTLRRLNAPAGATGEILHGADHQWINRYGVTITAAP